MSKKNTYGRADGREICGYLDFGTEYSEVSSRYGRKERRGGNEFCGTDTDTVQTGAGFFGNYYEFTGYDGGTKNRDTERTAGSVDMSEMPAPAQTQGRTYCIGRPYVAERHAATCDEEEADAPRPKAFAGYLAALAAQSGENGAPQYKSEGTRIVARQTESVRRGQSPRRASSAPHRQTERIGSPVRVLVGFIIVILVISSPLWLTGDTLLPYLKQFSFAAASVELPIGEMTSTAGIQDGMTVEPTTTASTTAPTTTTTTTVAIDPDSTLRPVSEQTIKGSGQTNGTIFVKNSTGYDLDIDRTLKLKPDCKIKLNAGYQVLIVHTHTTEGYAERTDGLYDTEYSPRTTDKSQSVVALGEIIAQKLEAAGIKTLHVTTAHDYPKYNGSYDRALETIDSYLEKYPSIEMVIDVHRDAITRDDGTKIKPTVTINGKKAAQIMIITGCDNNGKLDFPNYLLNLRMALRLQTRAAQTAEGLMRPLYYAPYRYNMHMTPNSLLVEFGTDVNTLEEARYSAELFGDILRDELLEYVV